MMSYLCTNQVLLTNLGDHVQKVTDRLKEASLVEAKACGRPIQYLNSSHIDKETIARKILAHDGVRSGLVCVLSSLEPCWQFEIRRNRLKKKLELHRRPGKCLFLYHYQSIPSSASSMPAFRPGSLSLSKSASTDGNGWPARCKPPASITCKKTTASLGLPTGPKLSVC